MTPRVRVHEELAREEAEDVEALRREVHPRNEVAAALSRWTHAARRPRSSASVFGPPRRTMNAAW